MKEGGSEQKPLTKQMGCAFLSRWAAKKVTVVFWECCHAAMRPSLCLSLAGGHDPEVEPVQHPTCSRLGHSSWWLQEDAGTSAGPSVSPQRSFCQPALSTITKQCALGASLLAFQPRGGHTSATALPPGLGCARNLAGSRTNCHNCV